VDREFLKCRLALAERHVAQEQMHVAQHRIIAELERDGDDTELARDILTSFEQSLDLHVEDRDRLIKALAGDHKSGGA